MRVQAGPLHDLATPDRAGFHLIDHAARLAGKNRFVAIGKGSEFTL
jgi:hypothetical protein